MALCERYSLVKSVAGGEVVKPLPCMTWDCDHCRPLLSRRLTAKALGGNPDMFMTLTCSNRVGWSRHDRARKLKHAFTMLLQAMRRRWPGRSFHYIAVFEETAQGEPHIHLLARSLFLPQKWVSKMMRKLLGSPIVDIRRITTVKAAANYIAKYMSKRPGRFEGCKRYWRSHGYDQRPKPERPPEMALDGPWRLLPVSANGYVHLRLMDGLTASYDGRQWLVFNGQGGGP